MASEFYGPPGGQGAEIPASSKSPELANGRQPDKSGLLAATVLFILPSYGVGGAEKQLANLMAFRPASAGKMRIHTITFLPDTSESVRRSFEAAGASNTLVDRSSKSFVSFFLELLRVLRRIRPAIVSTFLDGSTGTWGRLAALITGVPVLVHSDRVLAPELQWSHVRLRRTLDSSTARFLPNAHAIADQLVERGLNSAKIRVIPNGVDLSIFDPDNVEANRELWGISHHQAVLGYLGRFHPTKRIDLLLAALLRIDPKRRPDLVMLAGDGPSMPTVKAMVASDPWLATHCRLLGTIDNTASFLASIDYLVLPSDTEGLPNVVLEAMAMRRPVIATGTSDVPLLLAHTGVVVEPGSVEALAEAIERVQTMPSTERSELGTKARERIVEHYSIEVAARRFWRAHLELLDE